VIRRLEIRLGDGGTGARPLRRRVRPSRAARCRPADDLIGQFRSNAGVAGIRRHERAHEQGARSFHPVPAGSALPRDGLRELPGLIPPASLVPLQGEQHAGVDRGDEVTRRALFAGNPTQCLTASGQPVDVARRGGDADDPVRGDVAGERRDLGVEAGEHARLEPCRIR